MTRVIFLSLSAIMSGLVSCAAVSKAGENSAAFVKNATSQVSRFSAATLDKVRPAQVKVVEVREKDLKEQPTGEEQALAFEKKRKRSFWFFDGPVDFKEPSLPEAGGQMDGGLLPPKDLRTE